MASTNQQAVEAWQVTLKLQKHIDRQLEKIKTKSDSGTDISQFEYVEDLLQKFRLGCVSTIFIDFEYAIAENAEYVLWQQHVALNVEYRRKLGRLKGNSVAVERRKVEKIYNHFLRTSQQFYKGFVQRLAARYNIPALKRMAQGIGMELLPEKDVIDPSPDLSSQVHKSCHSTLIRLGDLARYRVQASHKKGGYANALAYYSLARDLLPDAGFSWHQMGIVSLEEGQHLDVLYHFYRALSVKNPHPNAKSNLENEFKIIQGPSKQKGRATTPSPHDALIVWFVKLHALLYKGDNFSGQQRELEQEVLHRLETAAKDTKCGGMLMKMALANMAAYDVASTKHTETKGEAVWRSSQYGLCFTVRFITKICEVLADDLAASMDGREEQSKQQDSNKSELTPLLQSLLPVLRTCSIWLSTCRFDIQAASSNFGNAVPVLYSTLAKVITLLCSEKFTQAGLATSPYLLPEDLEFLGLRALANDRVPEACRGYCTDDGRLKPHAEEGHQRLDPTQEGLARILDTLRCAYFFAEDPAVPMAYRIVEGQLIFESSPQFATNQNADVAVAVPVAAPAPAHVPAPAPAPAPAKAEQKKTSPARAEKSARSQRSQDRAAQYMKKKFNAAPGAERQTKQQKSPPATTKPPVDAAERTVLSMLSPFLDDPSSPYVEPQQENKEETSYGMHSPTANALASELLASYNAGTDAGSNTNGMPVRIPHPNSFKPSPRLNAEEARMAAFSGYNNGERASRGAFNGANSGEDPFAGPARQSMGNLSSSVGSLGGHLTGNHNNGNRVASTSEDSHRASLLNSFLNPMARPSSSSSPNQYNARAGSGWGHRQAGNSPIASNTSLFSHYSSIYGGTPANGLGYAQPGYGAIGTGQAQNGTGLGQSPGPSSGWLRGDQGTPAYDARNFQAAMQGGK